MAIVIESLFPEFSNQGGDNGNMMYLKASLSDAEFIETHFTDEPAFATRDVSMIYMGYMTEREEKKVAAKLLPYRDRLIELRDKGCVILFTGSAADLAGRSLRFDDGECVECLNLFDFETVHSYAHRYAQVYLGEFTPADGSSPLEIVGYKIQFTQATGDNSSNFFCKNKVGFGLNTKAAYEGFCCNNMFVTSLVGPILAINPLFCEYLMGKLGVEESRVAFRRRSMAAYEKRLEEFKTPGVEMPL